MSNNEKKALNAISFLLAIIAFCIFLFLFLGNTEVELRLQAINWFVLAVALIFVPLLLPFVRKITIGNSTLEMDALKNTVSLLQHLQSYLFKETSNLDFELLKKEVQKPDSFGVELLFHYLDGWRTQQVFQLIHAGSESLQHEIRDQIGRLEQIFLAFISMRPNNDPSLHNYYSRLAYIYKDRNPNREKNWELAYDYINRAIEHAPEEKGVSYTVYKFNRLLCTINLAEFRKLTARESQQMETDYAACMDEKETRGMLTATDKVIAPNLSKWLVETGRIKEV